MKQTSYWADPFPDLTWPLLRLGAQPVDEGVLCVEGWTCFTL